MLSKAATAGPRDGRTRQHDSWNFTPATTAGRLSAAASTSRCRLIPVRTLRRRSLARQVPIWPSSSSIANPKANRAAPGKVDNFGRRPRGAGGQSVGRRNVQRVAARFARASRDCQRLRLSFPLLHRRILPLTIPAKASWRLGVSPLESPDRTWMDRSAAGRSGFFLPSRHFCWRE